MPHGILGNIASCPMMQHNQKPLLTPCWVRMRPLSDTNLGEVSSDSFFRHSQMSKLDRLKTPTVS